MSTPPKMPCLYISFSLLTVACPCRSCHFRRYSAASSSDTNPPQNDSAVSIAGFFPQLVQLEHPTAQSSHPHCGRPSTSSHCAPATGAPSSLAIATPAPPSSSCDAPATRTPSSLAPASSAPLSFVQTVLPLTRAASLPSLEISDSSAGCPLAPRDGNAAGASPSRRRLHSARCAFFRISLACTSWTCIILSTAAINSCLCFSGSSTASAVKETAIFCLSSTLRTCARCSSAESAGRERPVLLSQSAHAGTRVFSRNSIATGEMQLPLSMSPGGALFLPSGLRHPAQSHQRAWDHGCATLNPFNTPFSGPVSTMVFSLAAAFALHGLSPRRAFSVIPPILPYLVVMQVSRPSMSTILLGQLPGSPRLAHMSCGISTPLTFVKGLYCRNTCFMVGAVFSTVMAICFSTNSFVRPRSTALLATRNNLRLRAAVPHLSASSSTSSKRE